MADPTQLDKSLKTADDDLRTAPVDEPILGQTRTAEQFTSAQEQYGNIAIARGELPRDATLRSQDRDSAFAAQSKVGNATLVERAKPPDAARAPSQSAAASESAKPKADATELSTAAQSKLVASATERADIQSVLQSLMNVTPIQFARAVDVAKISAASLLRDERDNIRRSLPEVIVPTGLPRAAPSASPRDLVPSAKPAAEADDEKSAGADQSEREESGSDEQSQSVIQEDAVPNEPQEEEGGSWWSWLVDALRSFLAGLPVTDSGIVTYAGDRPQLALAGAADSQKIDQQHQKNVSVVEGARAEADVATERPFGEDEIAPSVPESTAHANIAAEPLDLPDLSGAPMPELPNEAVAEFEAAAGMKVRESVGDQMSAYQQGRAKFDQDAENARSEGARQLAEADARAIEMQQDAKESAREEVDGLRIEWRGTNDQTQRDFEALSSEQRHAAHAQIETLRKSTDQLAEQRLAQAEREAEQARTKAESDAAAVKREAESRPRSIWERIKGGIRAAFNAIRRATRAIFNAARWFVRKLINAAKAAARFMVELGRRFVVGIIRAFGVAAKGFVTLALWAFPETARRARRAIDDVIETGVDAVNAAAQWLKEAYDAIFDWIGDTIDAALTLLEDVVLTAFDVLERVALFLVDIAALIARAIELIGKARKMVGPIIDIITDPSTAIEKIKNYLGALIARVPAEVEARVRGAITFSEPPRHHLEGIWRHLSPKLDYLMSNWWQVIKDTAWHMIWPFAEDSPLWKDASDFADAVAAVFEHIWNLEGSKAIDSALRALQLANSIVGLFYGWVFAILVIGGAIIGGPVGAAAGAALAGKIGVGMLVATVSIEAGIIAKSGYNLVFGANNPEQDEEDYERIAGSGLTLGITAAMAAVGWLAARIAKTVATAIANKMWRLPAKRGRAEAGPARGDVFEARVVYAAGTDLLVVLRRRAVTWLESMRRNFPVIDLVEGGSVVEIPRPGRRAPLYQVNGGRIISVKSTQQLGAAAQTTIRGWIDELATFTQKGNCIVNNPSGRTLIVAVETPLDDAARTALRTHAANNGVDLRITTSLPPNHPTAIFIDQIPVVMAEAGFVASGEFAED